MVIKLEMKTRSWDRYSSLICLESSRPCCPITATSNYWVFKMYPFQVEMCHKCNILDFKDRMKKKVKQFNNFCWNVAFWIFGLNRIYIIKLILLYLFYLFKVIIRKLKLMWLVFLLYSVAPVYDIELGSWSYMDLLCLKMFDKEKLQCFIPKTETILT